MPSKQKTSPIEDLIDLISRTPWWVGLIAALVSYLVLHWLAAPVPVQQANLHNMGGFAARTIIRAFANIAQYLVPLLCIASAALSVWRRRHRAALVNDVVASSAADKLDGMSWADFELLVGEAFRLDGFAVEERGGAQADGGIDLVLRQGNEKYLVQCKQWRAQKVGVAIVRELFGVMAARGAAGGFVVTSGAFTADAKEFAMGRNVILIDGPILLDMIERAERVRTANPLPSPSRVAPESGTQSVACPQCGSAMVRRTATRGTQAGNAFWGCSRFPACKGTRND